MNSASDSLGTESLLGVLLWHGQGSPLPSPGTPTAPLPHGGVTSCLGRGREPPVTGLGLCLEQISPTQGPASPCTPNARPRGESHACVWWGGPDRCHLTTSEIWLVDATDSGLEDEEEEDEEDEEKELPSETRFLLRLGMLLSLAGGRKGDAGSRR